MKKIVILVLCLIILQMTTPAGTAFATSGLCTSKSFVVRNWKGEVEPPAEELSPTEELTPEDDSVVDEPEEPEDDKPEEQDEEPLADDHTDDEPLPADEEQAIPSVDEDEDGQDEPDADEALGSDPGTDVVEESEELTVDDTPVDDGEEEITINTEEETVEPEEAGEARVDIGGSEAEGDGEPSD